VPKQPPIPWIQEALRSGVKGWERPAPPSGADVINEWNYIYTPMHAFTKYSGTTFVNALVSEDTAVTVDC